MRYLLLAALLLASSVQAETIYLCKAYAGGTFWSNALCSTQKALIERTANVPDGMPFLQQVALAESQLNSANALQQAPAPQPSAGGKSCPQLTQERRALDQITEKMIWVPIEQQNANYYRMNQIKMDMARLGCRY